MLEIRKLAYEEPSNLRKVSGAKGLMSEIGNTKRKDELEATTRPFILQDMGLWLKFITRNRLLVYILRRLLTIIPLFIGVSIILFTLMYLIGEPNLVFIIQVEILQ